MDERTKVIDGGIRDAEAERRLLLQALGGRVNSMHQIAMDGQPKIKDSHERTESIHNLNGTSLRQFEQRMEAKFIAPLAEMQASLSAMSALLPAHEAHTGENVSLV